MLSKVGYRKCSKKTIIFNKVVTKGLMDKVTVEKRSEGSEALHHMVIHERSNPSRKDPKMAEYSMCSSYSQETSALGAT